MKYFVLLLLILLSIVSPLLAKNVYCDADSDCFYVPQKVIDANKNAPALLYLSCTGAIKSDLDSIRFIADSLNWIIFSCHKSRNHRNAMQNDLDIIKTYNKAIKKYSIDTSKVFIYGFSGQGVQALMTMFLHPEMFRGAVTQCAHAQALPLADWQKLKNNLVYLISRQKDWNLNANYRLHNEFRKHNVRDTLVVTPGEHSIGNAQELFQAVKWLNKNLK